MDRVMNNSDTKEALLDHAQDLVQRLGANAMSYNDLSQAVGIRKASIHYHFPKKEDLIRALVERCQRVYGEQYRKIVDSDKSCREKLLMLASVFEQGVRNDKLCLIGMLSTEYASLNESIQEALKGAVVATSKIFEKAFRQGVAEDALCGRANTYDLAYGFLSFLMGAQIISRCAQNPRAFKKAAKAYIEAVTK
jgi:TetR/AcrR family transcriptional repressor of nem operon